ncbi:ABC transporter ATP-binding protein [Oscillochloris sp. ZM17-4]|uniref:ABC transporter ATP-binding protein n=1 Tax=Oscillochloris sp. ZM17-4 TaxID=2866714 RepID=UPI001C7311B0|nr:ABC transporter ATP-binding protein [Oscillochloris sp. ZM17-4]MBX0327567.1 ABC transporter ATP-binding protein [Oscillochloris sp. ZM17-4]
MNPSAQRLKRWAFRGALILAAVAIAFGALFTIMVAILEQALPTDAQGWLRMGASIVLLWGLGGLFFGAILGMYASMIWRDPGV